MAYLFQQIVKEGKDKGLKPGRVRTREWFRDKAKMVNKVNNQKLMREGILTSRINASSIGSMYMFFYDAKLKDKLPYWDRFPLVFPMGLYPDGFLGCNMHYLPPVMRAKLMDAFYTLRTDNNYDESTRIAMSYEILKASSRFSFFKPTIKRYLADHYKSRFLWIPPQEWDIALMLPTQRFQGKTKQVWRDSRARVKR